MTRGLQFKPDRQLTEACPDLIHLMGLPFKFPIHLCLMVVMVRQRTVDLIKAYMQLLPVDFVGILVVC